MTYVVSLPPCWIDAGRFELALACGGGPHDASLYPVSFHFPRDCKVMVDAGVRLLSIANQLSHTMRRIRLIFDEGEMGTMGYLNRMGFFDHLAKEIEVLPGRPAISGAKIYGGTNHSLVEIARINPSFRDDHLLIRLSRAVGVALSTRADASAIEGAVWLIFSELIDNIFSHSATILDGYAALQWYRNGNSLQVVVSDSGQGIMQTLRPTLQSQFPILARPIRRRPPGRGVPTGDLTSRR